MTFYAMKVVDLLIIVSLLFGSKSVSTFALILIAAMVVLTFVGVFLLDEEMARKLQEQSKFRASLRWIIYVAYPLALLYADHPGWAAAYVMALTLFMIGVNHKLKGAA